MSSSWIGHVVSADCGEMGVYQGHVLKVNNTDQTMTLGKTFRNGVPYNVPEVIIGAQNIKDLKILKTPAELSAEEHGCNQLSKKESTEPAKPAPVYRGSPDIRKTKCTPKRLGSPNIGSTTPGNGEYYRKRTNSASEISLSRSQQRSTPKKIESSQSARRKPREDCFSAPVDTFLEDFDFEKNLALFDKKAVFCEINGGQPTVVQIAEGEAKYRCDENVLQSKPIVLQQIKLPDGSAGDKLYTTDTGLVVPSMIIQTRQKLFAAAERLGYSLDRRLEMVGRSAAEMVLQLLGGVHRLNPKNSHQKPTVVVLCGPHMQGAQGINCARHLANRSVNATVFMPNFVQMDKYLLDELSLFNLTTGKRTASIENLPTHPVDIIINCLDDHERTQLLGEQVWYKTIVEWSNQNKAPVLSIDPPITGVAIETKWSLSVALPLSLSDKSGAMYLCDVGFPKLVFKELGIKYMSPFGHKFLIPLYVKTGS